MSGWWLILNGTQKHRTWSADREEINEESKTSVVDGDGLVTPAYPRIWMDGISSTSQLPRLLGRSQWSLLQDPLFLLIIQVNLWNNEKIISIHLQCLAGEKRIKLAYYVTVYRSRLRERKRLTNPLAMKGGLVRMGVQCELQHISHFLYCWQAVLLRPKMNRDLL